MTSFLGCNLGACGSLKMLLSVTSGERDGGGETQEDKMGLRFLLISFRLFVASLYWYYNIFFNILTLSLDGDHK